MSKIIVKIEADFQEIVPGYLEHRRKDILDLKSAVEKKDQAVVLVIGHKMRGSAGGYGFDALGKIGADLEDAAMLSKWDIIEKNIAALMQYLNDVEIVYE